ncbi:SEFIR domain-containing protein [Thiothrix caldifontis]|uniref:SEFIR domain-containing protein n=1 Tax=Thiothrix caldifontis TaxID=525918 RepID=A0A1H4F444_9GAMM|nr:SEFIR domain-containing protein [Thiothrix caldifontis]SEA91677.1 SEFIR domain-containing protein [Thiothrix caldifontis]
MTKVFISYSHEPDNAQHSQQVLALSDRLNKSDLDCDIDQYINGSPEEGWPLWMERMLDEASHVLIICTETYLNRVQRKEKPGTGKGVKWESLLTYQDIYDNDSLNRKFIPVVFTADNAAFIPKPLKAVSHYDLSRDDTYEKLLRFLTGQPLAIKPKPGQTPHLPPTNATLKVTCVNSDELTIVKGRFFGRKAELALLDAVWTENVTRIIQFTAAGGTGKTKLLRHWLDNTSDITYLAWSFYAQGSTEDKQTSATPFFLYVLEALQSPHSLSYFDQQPEALGRHIAALVHAQRCVLVLDGLEPLQHADKGNRGELKDRALKALVKSLMGQNDGLCIITTRIPLYEISDRDEPLVIRYTLENLHVDDGVELLKSLKVRGKPDDLATAVKAYGCHALALNLLGALLSKRYQGDVNQHIQLKALVNPTGDRESRHAFKVMQTYAEVLAGTPELKLLNLLGLFDHSIDLAVLRVLWQAQIPDLTAAISEDDWLDAIDAIRNEWYLLTDNSNNPKLLDCHPLIREYFGKQLKDNQPEIWQQAHERLYEYYKALPEKELPDTLEEMQPLFSAVVHGCSADLHNTVWQEVYWLRIERSLKSYLSYSYVHDELGATGDELAILSSFFLGGWNTISSNLSEDNVGAILKNPPSERVGLR